MSLSTLWSWWSMSAPRPAAPDPLELTLPHRAGLEPLLAGCLLWSLWPADERELWREVRSSALHPGSRAMALRLPNADAVHRPDRVAALLGAQRIEVVADHTGLDPLLWRVDGQAPAQLRWTRAGDTHHLRLSFAPGVLGWAAMSGAIQGTLDLLEAVCGWSVLRAPETLTRCPDGAGLASATAQEAALARLSGELLRLAERTLLGHALTPAERRRASWGVRALVAAHERAGAGLSLRGQVLISEALLDAATALTGSTAILSARLAPLVGALGPRLDRPRGLAEPCTAEDARAIAACTRFHLSDDGLCLPQDADPALARQLMAALLIREGAPQHFAEHTAIYDAIAAWMASPWPAYPGCLRQEEAAFIEQVAGLLGTEPLHRAWQGHLAPLRRALAAHFPGGERGFTAALRQARYEIGWGQVH